MSGTCRQTKHRYLIMAAMFLVSGIALPRMYAGTLLVRYDILFLDSQGNGYAPTLVSLGAKFVSLAVFVAALLAFIRLRSERLLWLPVGILSAVSFLSIGVPPESHYFRTIDRGQTLVQQIEAYHDTHDRYPDQLRDLPNAPRTGLAEGRRFYYLSADSRLDDRGDWFPSTRAYLGSAPYVICVPLVPGGTHVYRPTHEYSDLRGYPLSHGWFHTTSD